MFRIFCGYSVGYSIVQVCCCSILAYLLVAPVESAADSCKVSAQRPSKPYTSICSPLMALPAAWSDHTAVVEFLLEKGRGRGRPPRVVPPSPAVLRSDPAAFCSMERQRGVRLLAHSTRPFHAAAWTAVPRCQCWGQTCILQHGTAAWSAAVGALHAAVPRCSVDCRSTLPVLRSDPAAFCSMERPRGVRLLAHSTRPFHAAVPRCQCWGQTPLHSAAWNGRVECGCWRTPRGRSTLPFHAASAEVRPRCILQHGTAAWSAPSCCAAAWRTPRCRSTLPFHTAVPRCRSTLPFHAAECSGRKGLGEHLCSWWLWALRWKHEKLCGSRLFWTSCRYLLLIVNDRWL